MYWIGTCALKRQFQLKANSQSDSPLDDSTQIQIDLSGFMLTWYGRIIVQLDAGHTIPRFLTAKISCEELDRFKREAASAFLKAKRIRFSREVSIYEDAELCREWRRRIYDLIKHLLIGHEGSACLADDRPIVRTSEPELRLPRELPLGLGVASATYRELPAAQRTCRQSKPL